jgi:hypothetical protein
LAIFGDFDDGGGNELYICRFPHIFFALIGPVPKTLTTTPTLVEQAGIPDSTRVGELRMWTPPGRTTDSSCPRGSAP